jgi:hypothetical protein
MFTLRRSLSRVVQARIRAEAQEELRIVLTAQVRDR